MGVVGELWIFCDINDCSHILEQVFVIFVDKEYIWVLLAKKDEGFLKIFGFFFGINTCFDILQQVFVIFMGIVYIWALLSKKDDGFLKSFGFSLV